MIETKVTVYVTFVEVPERHLGSIAEVANIGRENTLWAPKLWVRVFFVVVVVVVVVFAHVSADFVSVISAR